jgi:predicted nucleic acid-binding protein
VITYLDSSVIVRVVLREPDALPEWEEVKAGVTSEIALVECNRALLRLHLHQFLDDAELAEKQQEIREIMKRVDLVRVDRQLLRRAAGSFGVMIATLDAIHLVSAMIYRESRNAQTLRMATHDRQLAAAGRGMNFPVLGA